MIRASDHVFAVVFVVFFLLLIGGNIYVAGYNGGLDGSTLDGAGRWFIILMVGCALGGAFAGGLRAGGK